MHSLINKPESFCWCPGCDQDKLKEEFTPDKETFLPGLCKSCQARIDSIGQPFKEPTLYYCEGYGITKEKTPNQQHDH